MKIGFITTINTNIGDDFIRQGIINILRQTYINSTFEFAYVNKHYPYSVYPKWHPLRYYPFVNNLKFGRNILRKLAKRLAKFGMSKFDSCDLIIQSGAPVLWPDCHVCEWNVPIWQQVVGRLHERVPVFNIAAGSCYPWENQNTYFTSVAEKSYAKMIGENCRVTTTRDVLASKLFDSVNVANTLLPCTAFFVDPDFDNTNRGEYVLINYMEGGGHFDWGQNIKGNLWEATIKEVIKNLKKAHEVRFICHDNKEVELAKGIDPSLIIHFPKTVAEYLDCVKAAKIGINNRMHASISMASVGVPSISVCTDTRLLMAKNLELPVFYVKNINSNDLLYEALRLLANAQIERRRLFELKIKSFKDYVELFGRSL